MISTLKTGQITIIIYAAGLFLGGLEGLITKGSVISLLASALFAVLLLFALRTSLTRPKFGLGLGALFVLLSFGRFAGVFLKKHEMWPAGFYTIFGSLAAVIIGTAFLMTREEVAQPASEYPR